MDPVDLATIRMSGSTYVELPTFLALKRCIVNVKNNDDRCFGYSVLSAINPVDRSNNPNQPYHYNHQFKWRGLDQIQYPVDISDIPEIEKKLQVSFNIISHSRYRMHISKNYFPIHIDLLYWWGHYAWIKHFSRFMSDITAHKRKKFFCHKCLNHFGKDLIMDDHKLLYHTWKQLCPVVAEEHMPNP